MATQSCCAICGRPVDFSLKYPDPMCATVDHIIPIAKGGHPSDIENLQLAHFQCNRRKGEGLRSKEKQEQIKKDSSGAALSNRNLTLSADWRLF